MNPGDPRDRALEVLLSGRARPGPPTAQCVDAETLAAYAEGGLGAQARAEAEAHMAACAHCQAVMAALVTSAEEVTHAPVQVPERRWWSVNLRWLMPLAGTAAAAVLWMVVPSGSPRPQSAPIQDAPVPAAIEPGTEAPALKREASPPVVPSPGDGGALTSAAPQDAAERATRKPTGDLAVRQADQSLRERVETDAPAAPLATPGSRAAEANRAAAPAPAAEAFRSPGPSALTTTPINLRSLDPAVRWRLTDPGIVERSTNGGASWERLDTGVRIPLRAGACPSASTCWIVGDAGVVLLITDPQTWQRAASPSPEDLVAVETTDGTAAIVRTASGQRFRTGDGGRTWAPAP